MQQFKVLGYYPAEKPDKLIGHVRFRYTKEMGDPVPLKISEYYKKPGAKEGRSYIKAEIYGDVTVVEHRAAIFRNDDGSLSLQTTTQVDRALAQAVIKAARSMQASEALDAPEEPKNQDAIPF